MCYIQADGNHSSIRNCTNSEVICVWSGLTAHTEPKQNGVRTKNGSNLPSPFEHFISSSNQVKVEPIIS